MNNQVYFYTRPAVEALVELREPEGDLCYRTSLMTIASYQFSGMSLMTIGTDVEELRELRNKGSEAVVRQYVELLQRDPKNEGARQTLQKELRRGFIPPGVQKDLLEKVDVIIHLPPSAMGIPQ